MTLFYIPNPTQYLNLTTTGSSHKLECREKFIFSCKLFQKVKLSYILDSLHVK